MNIFQSFLELVQFKDLFDIALVAMMIYQLLVIVRGTRAVQMLIGVGGLGILYWVGVTYKLLALNWFLQHFFESFFIIVVILFQDQIRTALAFVGSGSRFWHQPVRGTDEDQMLVELSEAVINLSEHRVGGLIAIERRHGLKNFSLTGVKIDSLVKADLIVSIFTSTTPIHDGAIVIRAGRIWSAGCFLPLAGDMNLERQWGTRHRAALGLSQVSDALVLVVSEETGTISIGKYGELKKVAVDEDVLTLIKNSFQNDKVVDSIFRRKA